MRSFPYPARRAVAARSSAAIQSSTTRPSSVSGSAPWVSTTSWKRSRSKRGPSAARAFAQREDLELADLVRARLPRPHHVALDLAHHGGGVHAGVGDHVRDRALAGPALAVDAGVHHQPRGAEQLGLQRAERVGRGRVEALLEREVLGVQRPALDVGRERDHAPEERHAGELLRHRDLEVVPRDALVIRERAHAGTVGLARVAQVGVEHARPPAVERAALVVGAGAPGLAELRHATHLEPRVRPHMEQRVAAPARVVEDGLIVGEDARAARVARRIAEPRLVAERVHRAREPAVVDPLALEQRPHLGLDPRHLGQPERVDAVGTQVAGGVVTQAPRVVRIALGQRPHAVARARPVAHVLGRGDQPVPGRVHHGGDEPGEPLGEARAFGGGEVLRLHAAAGERLDQRRLGRRVIAERVHLGERALEHPARRVDPAPLARVDPLDHAVHRHAEARHALEVALRLARVVERMRVHHEVGQLDLEPAHLLDRVVVLGEAPLPFGLVGEEPVEHVGREPPVRAHPAARVLAQDPQLVLHEAPVGLLAARRPVVEPSGMEVEPRAVAEPELAHELGMAQHEAGEHPRVEHVDLPRAEEQRGDQPQQRQRGHDDRDARGHATRAAAHDGNCPRKRRSFSRNSRISGTPCRSMAMRSRPMPNANPVTFSGS